MAVAIEDSPSSGVEALEDPSGGCFRGEALPGGSSIPRARAIPSGLDLSAIRERTRPVKLRPRSCPDCTD
jgi:hypothetical protein